MTFRRMARLAAAILSLWSVVGALSWFLYDPVADKLVGARTPAGGRADVHVFAPRDLQAVAERVGKSYLWGLPPDGTKGNHQETVEKMVEWRVLAARIIGKERSLLVEIDKKKLERIKEGEVLPDGSLVKDIAPSGYTIQNADRELVTTQLNF